MPKQALQLLLRFRDQIPESSAIALLNRPDSGNVFVFYPDSDKDDRFKADGCWWRNVGSHTTDYGVTVSYYQIRQPPAEQTFKTTHTSAFEKTLFQLEVNEVDGGLRPLIIWFVGDKTVVREISHGNSKSETPFLPTLPSVLKTVKTNCDKFLSTERVYMSLKNLHGLSDGKSQILKCDEKCATVFLKHALFCS